MTTWLRDVVERRTRRTNPSFSLSLFSTKNIFIHFLTNRKSGTGILATGCRLTTSSSILDIQLLPMIYSCPVVSQRILVNKNKLWTPPSIYVFLQVYYLSILAQYFRLVYSFLDISIYSLFSTNVILLVYRQGNLIYLDSTSLSFVGQLIQLMQYYIIISTIPHSTSIMYVALLQTITK